MRRILVLLFGVFVPLVMIVLVFLAYSWVFDDNTKIDSAYELFVYSEEDPRDVLDKLLADEVVDDERSFILVAQQKKWYTAKPGRYLIEPGMSNNEMVNMLRAGLQTPVSLTINNVESIAEVSGQIGQALMVDSTTVFQAFVADTFLQGNGLNYTTVRYIIIPNPYEMYWNTSVEKLRERLLDEHNRFWNDDRQARANAIGLNELEVSTLASIVQKETSRLDEMPVVAGLYLNRLKRGMKLQSDPTVIYAKQLRDGITVKRVLYEDLEIDSPYNTYQYAGLPPAPITIATIQAIDAVLHAANHNYIYMCADPDNPGYHSFAANSRQHSINRQKYIKWLNEQGIRR